MSDMLAILPAINWLTLVIFLVGSGMYTHNAIRFCQIAVLYARAGNAEQYDAVMRQVGFSLLMASFMLLVFTVNRP